MQEAVQQRMRALQEEVSLLMEKDAVSTARIAELEAAVSDAACDSELIAKLKRELAESRAASSESEQRCDALSSRLCEMESGMQRASAASTSEFELLSSKLWDAESLLAAASASCAEAEAARDLLQAQLTAAARRESDMQEAVQQRMRALQEEVSLLMEKDAVSTARIAELEVALACSSYDPEQQQKVLQQESELQDQRQEQRRLMEQLESMAETILQLQSDNRNLMESNEALNIQQSDTLRELQDLRGLHDEFELERNAAASEKTCAMEERLEELMFAAASAESERAQLMQHLNLCHRDNSDLREQLQQQQLTLLSLQSAAASHSDTHNELELIRLELSAMTQKEAHSSSVANQARLDADMLQSKLKLVQARVVELESNRDPHFDVVRMQVSDIFNRHVLIAKSPASHNPLAINSSDAATSAPASTAAADASELASLRSRLASSELAQVSLASQLAESDAFVQCVRQSVLQLEKQVAKLKSKLKSAVAGESAAVARAHDCELREKDAQALAQAMSIELTALRSKQERKLVSQDTCTLQSAESERRVAALESGMQALMNEGSRALESALAIAMREGSARAVLADEVQLLRQVSQQPEPCAVVEPSLLAVLSTSVPALLRRRILFSRQIMCKAAVCRTQLSGFQHELTSLASAWRCSVATMQRESSSAVLAAVAAAHRRRIENAVPECQ
jgi:hypothetical protein